MNARIVDVDLENYRAIPRACRATVFWEFDHDDPSVNARFQKEEWFSSTMLEWGPCGKLALAHGSAREPATTTIELEPPEDERTDAVDRPDHRPDDRDAAADPSGIGFAQYAPPPLFARRLAYVVGSSTSEDALFLAYVFVEEEHRGQGVGSALIRHVARAAADRGYGALEAIGDRRSQEEWVLPVTFLAANGFRVVVDDERFPLLRRDIRERIEPRVAGATVALPGSEPSV